ncbi:hypothetical protein NQ314_004057, partial [Rhamnusium bicolor]
KPSEKSYEQLCDIMFEQFSQQQSVWRERIKFYEVKQESSECFSEFYARVKSLAVNCEFGERLEETLKDKLMSGLKKGKLLDRLCEESIKKSLKGLVQLAMQKETESKSAAEVNQLSKITQNRNHVPTTAPQVGENQYAGRPRGGAKGFDRRSRWQPQTSKHRAKLNDSCVTCGKYHLDKCKYLNFNCNVCKKRGHLAKVCRFREKPQNFIGAETVMINDQCENICAINRLSNSENPFAVRVKINNRTYNMDLDSGASVSCVSEKTYNENFAIYPLKDDSTVLKGYNGQTFTQIGQFTCLLTYGNITREQKFYVVKNGGPNILGRDWMQLFNVGINIVNAVQNVPSQVQNLMDRYNDIFNNELGLFKYNKVSLQLKPNAMPVFCKPRNVPIAYKKALEEELCRLESLNVITPIETSFTTNRITASKVASYTIKKAQQGTSQTVINQDDAPENDCEWQGRSHGWQCRDKDISQGQRSPQIRQVHQKAHQVLRL